MIQLTCVGAFPCCLWYLTDWNGMASVEGGDFFFLDGDSAQGQMERWKENPPKRYTNAAVSIPSAEVSATLPKTAARTAAALPPPESKSLLKYSTHTQARMRILMTKYEEQKANILLFSCFFKAFPLAVLGALLLLLLPKATAAPTTDSSSSCSAAAAASGNRTNLSSPLRVCPPGAQTPRTSSPSMAEGGREERRAAATVAAAGAPHPRRWRRGEREESRRGGQHRSSEHSLMGKTEKEN